MKNTKILWFTGLSGSGKTTIANELKVKLEQTGKTVMLIDGDTIRDTIHRHLKFTREDIEENNRLIVLLCKENIGNHDFIIVSVISPFQKSREFARKTLSGDFLEIYIKADLEECIKRDKKGLYKKALAGKIDNFIGISENVPYEEPLNPDILVDAQQDGAALCVNKILKYLRQSL